MENRVRLAIQTLNQSGCSFNSVVRSVQTRIGHLLGQLDMPIEDFVCMLIVNGFDNENIKDGDVKHLMLIIKKVDGKLKPILKVPMQRVSSINARNINVGISKENIIAQSLNAFKCNRLNINGLTRLHFDELCIADSGPSNINIRATDEISVSRTNFNAPNVKVGFNASRVHFAAVQVARGNVQSLMGVSQQLLEDGKQMNKLSTFVSKQREVDVKVVRNELNVKQLTIDGDEWIVDGSKITVGKLVNNAEKTFWNAIPEGSITREGNKTIFKLEYIPSELMLGKGELNGKSVEGSYILTFFSLIDNTDVMKNHAVKNVVYMVEEQMKRTFFGKTYRKIEQGVEIPQLVGIFGHMYESQNRNGVLDISGCNIGCDQLKGRKQIKERALEVNSYFNVESRGSGFFRPRIKDDSFAACFKNQCKNEIFLDGIMNALNFIDQGLGLCSDAFDIYQYSMNGDWSKAILTGLSRIVSPLGYSKFELRQKITIKEEYTGTCIVGSMRVNNKETEFRGTWIIGEFGLKTITWKVQGTTKQTNQSFYSRQSGISVDVIKGLLNPTALLPTYSNSCGSGETEIIENKYANVVIGTGTLDVQNAFFKGAQIVADELRGKIEHVTKQRVADVKKSSETSSSFSFNTGAIVGAVVAPGVGNVLAGIPSYRAVDKSEIQTSVKDNILHFGNGDLKIGSEEEKKVNSVNYNHSSGVDTGILNQMGSIYNSVGHMMEKLNAFRTQQEQMNTEMKEERSDEVPSAKKAEAKKAEAKKGSTRNEEIPIELLQESVEHIKQMEVQFINDSRFIELCKLVEKENREASINGCIINNIETKEQLVNYCLGYFGTVATAISDFAEKYKFVTFSFEYLLKCIPLFNIRNSSDVLKWVAEMGSFMFSNELADIKSKMVGSIMDWVDEKFTGGKLNDLKKGVETTIDNGLYSITGFSKETNDRLLKCAKWLGNIVSLKWAPTNIFGVISSSKEFADSMKPKHRKDYSVYYDDYMKSRSNINLPK